MTNRIPAALAAASIVLAAGFAPAGATAAVKKIDGKNLKTKSISGKSLRDRTITTAKLADGAVNSNKLLNGAVGTLKLGDNAVTSAKIADGAILFQDLDVSVQNLMKSGGVLPGSIVTDHLADNSVTAPKIADNAVGSSEIAPDAVGDEELAPNGVNSDEVEDNSLTADDLAANSVGASELGADSVGTSEVANGSLNAIDVGMRRGASAENFAPVPANSCTAQSIDTGDPTNLESDIVLVTPRSGFSGAVSFHAETNANELITIKTCNPTGAVVDPDGGAGTIYNWIVFDN
ncbi:MAG TPA: hypothetical protein VFZ89_18510 [Solirubrobacteraceae bacterium]